MTSEALALASELQRRGIQLKADGDRLRCRPRSRLTQDLLDRIKRLKPALLSILATSGTNADVRPEDLPLDWRIEWEERAAIRQYDGGQTRAEADVEALREILVMVQGDAQG
jgi:hypothetical protein